jgi:hypothetical protein
MAVTRTPKPLELEVIDLERGNTDLYIVGTSPFYCNRMGAKAQRELLLPRGTLTRAQKATKLKHAPLAEFRDSPYMRRTITNRTPWRNEITEAPAETLLTMRAVAPKKAMAAAALDMPTSVTKAAVGRLIQVNGDYVPLWGRPYLDMSVVRQAGIAKTPDIRTRARLNRWAMRISLSWVKPMLNATLVGQLLNAAGVLCGLGDFRQEKGGGSFGMFRIAPPDDPELIQIMAEGDYREQALALRDPECVDWESDDLLSWYFEELKRRGVNPEDETVEDVEVDPELVSDEDLAKFGAGAEVVDAPRGAVRNLPLAPDEDSMPVPRSEKRPNGGSGPGFR